MYVPSIGDKVRVTLIDVPAAKLPIPGVDTYEVVVNGVLPGGDEIEIAAGARIIFWIRGANGAPTQFVVPASHATLIRSAQTEKFWMIIGQHEATSLATRYATLKEAQLEAEACCKVHGAKFYVLEAVECVSLPERPVCWNKIH